MLNLGTIYGATTGGFGGWLLGRMEGPYSGELVSLMNHVVVATGGPEVASMMGGIGLLALFGVVTGACVGTVIHGRSKA